MLRKAIAAVLEEVSGITDRRIRNASQARELARVEAEVLSVMQSNAEKECLVTRIDHELEAQRMAHKKLLEDRHALIEQIRAVEVSVDMSLT